MSRLRTPRARRGQSMVEFAMVLPLVMLVLLGVIEFAMLGHHKLSLAQGARAGARKAALGRPLAEIKSTVIAATPSAAVSQSQIVVEYNSLDNGQGSWLPAYDNSRGTANAVPSGRLIRVRIVNWPHRLITGSFFSWLPGVSNNQVPVSAQMVMMRE